MNQQMDWSDSAVDFAEGYLENDGGEIVEISAETRAMAKTIIVLSRHIQSKGESADPAKRQLLLALLDKVEELNLIDAFQFFLTAVAKSRDVVNVTLSPVSALAAGSNK